MTPVSAEDLAEHYGPRYKWYVTGTVMLGTSAMVLSATIVNVALPDIMGEFGMGQDKAQWLSTAFLAAMTATMLVTAWAIGRFGTRSTYIAALVVFSASSILGGLSPNGDVLILARTLQGAAAGLVQPLAMVVIFRAFPPSERGTAMGIYGVGVILAPALGPTLGGMLIDNYTWRDVFYLGPPFCFAGILLAPTFLATRPAGRPVAFDIVGFALLSVAIAALLTSMANGQRQGWDSPLVTGGFVVTALGTLGFIWHENRTQTPILSLGVYLNPRFAAASAVAFILGLGLYGSTYLVPLFVQTVQGYTPTESGLLLMPAGLALGVVFPLAGRLSDRLPPYVLILSGLALFGVSSALMSAADTSTDFWVFAGWVVVGRIGLGLILPSLNVGALRVLDPALVSQGAGAINFMRQLGGAVGVGALSVALERQTALHADAFNALQTGGPAATETLNRLAVLMARAGIPDSPLLSLHSLEAYRFLSSMIAAQASVMGFRDSFLLVGVIFFVALVPAWLMRPRRNG
ncbi:DHA2 family efflux MFS transporter permease subunit [Magnetospirillum molischianum]|uniref:Drug resistance transporter, EmrB/QacA subfamily n=1 Tax=Magnetospirillum molischianum DSM 120 TaxID=1150626 RepID=H8FV39_MAGML|nr:DHA2 family efflux MFS transporter permease subunit [Magnetospirillum molischianum]CCG42227.1 Drug resistance transporter, EmrB/QacA subfamily [Magnetospirillum molischianum DSM 120]